jgi:hypothetical protein
VYPSTIPNSTKTNLIDPERQGIGKKIPFCCNLLPSLADDLLHVYALTCMPLHVYLNACPSISMSLLARSTRIRRRSLLHSLLCYIDTSHGRPAAHAWQTPSDMEQACCAGFKNTFVYSGWLVEGYILISFEFAFAYSMSEGGYSGYLRCGYSIATITVVLGHGHVGRRLCL